MEDPLQLLKFRTRQVRPEVRRAVGVPTADSSTDALFVVLRRMRRPLIVVITVFSICTAGMMLMPGVDPEGNPYKLTLFDSFYQMTITLTTVGYTEAPHAFSYAQRMWVALSIFMLVISWAYAIGSLFAALQSPAFQDALAAQRFRGQVRRLVEPFFIVIGYGQTGHRVGRELDIRRRRFVVIDRDEAKVEGAATEPLSADVPAVEGDCSDPAVLGLAGLAKPSCQGVLALTNSDEDNLAAVMTVALLRPEVPIYARCTDRQIARQMEGFGPTALINPHDRYGGYLSLAAHQPVIHQLLTWLMENEHPELVPEHSGLADGLWVVCGHGQFAEEVAHDLERSGLHVKRVDEDEDIDLHGAVAFVAGAANDMTNLALAEAARQENPDIFLAVRQIDSMHRPLLDAMDVDSVFIATELVAREALARIVNPNFWLFVEEAVQQDDAWAAALRDRLVEHCGRRIPERDVISIDDKGSPAIARWIRAGHEITVGDLRRHPDARDHLLPLEALLVVRDGELLLTPPDDTRVELGDQILFAGRSSALADLSDAMFSPAAVEYVATGHQVPSTWVWRVLTRRRARPV